MLFEHVIENALGGRSVRVQVWDAEVVTIYFHGNPTVMADVSMGAALELAAALISASNACSADKEEVA